MTFKKNNYNPAIHHRRSIRLKGYDYSSPGYYFVTICTQNRVCLFGEIINGQMQLNDAGNMVDFKWVTLPNRFDNIRIDEYSVMPNHFHAILEIVPPTPVGAPLVGAHHGTHHGTPNAAHRDVIAVVNHSEITLNESGQPQGIAPTGIAPTGIAPTGIAPTSIAPTSITPTSIRKTLGDMVGAFQSIVTVEYIRGVKTNNWQSFHKKLWQRDYWEHIIRNDLELLKIRNYIKNNPKNWNRDKFNGAIENRVQETMESYGEDPWMI